MNCGPLHIKPEKWDRVRGTDGHTRAYCPACKAFKGYVSKEELARSKTAGRKD